MRAQERSGRRVPRRAHDDAEQAQAVPGGLLGLQRAAGNRAVTALVSGVTAQRDEDVLQREADETIRPGDSSPQVMVVLQSILSLLHQDLGSPSISNVYGREEQAMVRFYQSSRGLNADGVIGPDTRAHIASESGGAPAVRPLFES